MADEIENEVVATEGSLLHKSVFEPLYDFYVESRSLVESAHKPDMKEYFEVLRAVGLGLFVMGGLGYAVRLLHYPVKEVLMGKI